MTKIVKAGKVAQPKHLQGLPDFLETFMIGIEILDGKGDLVQHDQVQSRHL